MAYTLQQVSDLEAAIAQGALKVKYQDKEVDYRSIGDMILTLNIMRKALGISPNTISLITPIFCKGI